MENPLTKLEFGNVKLLRKNLMVSSATAIVISQLVEYSEGAMSFLAFTISCNNKPILNKLMWWIVLYFMVALVIRYFDEELIKWYKKEMKSIEFYNNVTYEADTQTTIDQIKFIKENRWKDNLRKRMVFFMDVIAPFALAVVALYMSYAFNQ